MLRTTRATPPHPPLPTHHPDDCHLPPWNPCPQAELTARGPKASLIRAVVRTWLPRYVLPMTLSMLFLTLGCLSAALFMRGLVQWFERRDEGVGRAVMLVILLTLSEMGKVRTLITRRHQAGSVAWCPPPSVCERHCRRLHGCPVVQSVFLNQMWHCNLVGE